MQVGLSHGHIVLDGDPAPHRPKGHSPQFSAHICCGQMAGWIKMPLGMEIGSGLGEYVLDGDRAPLSKKGLSTIFSPCLLWPNSWMDQDGTWRGGGPRSRPHCARWGASSPKKGAQLPIFGPCLMSPNAWMIKILLGMEVGLSPGDCVRWGPSPRSPKKEQSPQFSAHVSRWIKMPLGTEVGRSLRDIVLDGDPAPPPLRGHSPQFLANVRRGQTAGRTKMPLGVEVGLGPGDFCVRSGTPEKRAHQPHPIFGPCLLWPNGWMDEDCIRRRPSSPLKGHSSRPSFQPMSILSYC